MKIEYQKFIDAIKEISKEINENQDWLSELDQSVGDGDHGVNMSRGFNEVAKLDHTNLSLSNYISLIGRTLMSKVGEHSSFIWNVFYEYSKQYKRKPIIYFKRAKNTCSKLC